MIVTTAASNAQTSPTAAPPRAGRHVHVGARSLTSSHRPRRHALYTTRGLELATRRSVPSPISTVRAGGALLYLSKMVEAGVMFSVAPLSLVQHSPLPLTLAAALSHAHIQTPADFSSWVVARIPPSCLRHWALERPRTSLGNPLICGARHGGNTLGHRSIFTRFAAPPSLADAHHIPLWVSFSALQFSAGIRCLPRLRAELSYHRGRYGMSHRCQGLGAGLQFFSRKVFIAIKYRVLYRRAIRTATSALQHSILCVSGAHQIPSTLSKRPVPTVTISSERSLGTLDELGSGLAR